MGPTVVLVIPVSCGGAVQTCLLAKEQPRAPGEFVKRPRRTRLARSEATTLQQRRCPDLRVRTVAARVGNVFAFRSLALHLLSNSIDYRQRLPAGSGLTPVARTCNKAISSLSEWIIREAVKFPSSHT
jgi:hypothetical protein